MDSLIAQANAPITVTPIPFKLIKMKQISSDYRVFDLLIDSDIRFSLYKLPQETSIRLIIQETDKDFILDNIDDINEDGFIIAPFKSSASNPIIRIKPEIVLDGEKAIFDYLKTIKLKTSTSRRIALEPHNNTTKEEYTSVYNKFHAKLLDQSFQKVVLSRIYKKNRPNTFSAGIAFREACKRYPNEYVYLCHTPLSSTWLGATPELLLSQKDQEWKTVALAGTRQELSKPTTWDTKNQQEQAIVAEYIDKLLADHNCVLTKSDTTTAHTGKLEHLKTEFTFTPQNTSIKLGSILSSLHPTPAVCGMPKALTYDFIVNNEGHNRRYYSGFLGEISKHSAQIFVNLRCMNIQPDNLFLYAGSGLLPTSSVDMEWNETELKLEVMKAIID